MYSINQVLHHIQNEQFFFFLKVPYVKFCNIIKFKFEQNTFLTVKLRIISEMGGDGKSPIFTVLCIFV